MDFQKLSQTALFQGTTAQETEAVLKCLGVEQRNFEKDEIILHMGDTVTSIGIVMYGSVFIENDDVWGNRTILDRVGKGGIFAETYACVPGEKLMVNVTAAEQASVLFLNAGRILKTCPNSCSHHGKLIRNLLALSARKNLSLSRKIFHTSAKSIRGRLLSYLSWQALQCGGTEFDIPFNRQQLADYLSVDRSALSNELGRMQKDGLIRVSRNHFILSDEME